MYTESMSVRSLGPSATKWSFNTDRWSPALVILQTYFDALLLLLLSTTVITSVVGIATIAGKGYHLLQSHPNLSSNALVPVSRCIRRRPFPASRSRIFHWYSVHPTGDMGHYEHSDRSGYSRERSGRLDTLQGEKGVNQKRKY